MVSKLLAFTLSASFLLMQPGFALAGQQGGSQGWSVVQSVPTGTELRVETKDGKKINGRLASVSDSGLTITRKGKDHDLDRDSIKRIHRVMGRSRSKSAAIGAVTGGAIGIGTGLAIYLPAKDDIVGAVVPVFGLIGGGAGALIGTAFGRGKKRILIYEAP